LKSQTSGSDNLEADAEIVREDENGKRGQLDGLKILVVDDEPDALELTAFILTEQDALVFTANSVDEALGIYEKENLDALVSDIGMPERDGLELIREIKARAARAATVALTAYAREEDSRQVLEAGFDAYLPKPVEPAKLIEVIVEVTRT
jgi:CheY-like chemotaxis protein